MNKCNVVELNVVMVFIEKHLLALVKMTINNCLFFFQQII